MMQYGWKRDIPTTSDLIYTPTMSSGITSVDYRTALPAVYTQGTSGSCTAQAIAAMIQYNEKKQNIQSNVIPSRLFMYYNSRLIQHTTDSDSGTSMKIGIRSLVDYGYCSEEFWPYDTTQSLVRPAKIAYRYAGTHKITQFGRIAQDINQLKATLSGGSLFCFGFTAFTNYESDEVKTSGILNLPAADEVALGGHGVLAVGFDDGDGTFIVRNSLGPDWGIDGYFKMPYSYLSDPNLSSDFWTITAVPIPVDTPIITAVTPVVTSPSVQFTPTAIPLPTKPIPTTGIQPPIDTSISPNDNAIYNNAINTLNPVNLINDNSPVADVAVPIYPTILPVDSPNNTPNLTNNLPNVATISGPLTIINRVNQPYVDPSNVNQQPVDTSITANQPYVNPYIIDPTLPDPTLPDPTLPVNPLLPDPTLPDPTLPVNPLLPDPLPIDPIDPDVPPIQTEE